MKHDTETLTECRKMPDEKLNRWIADRFRANNYGAARLGRGAVQEERAGGLPVESIHWSEIPRDAKVEDNGGCFVATLPGGSRAVAFWNGNENDLAQHALWTMAKRSNRESR